MAASETGATGWVFGKGALTSAQFDSTKSVFTNIKFDLTPSVKVDLKDMDGLVIARRRDDRTFTISCTAKVKSDFTELTIGAVVVIANCQLEAVNGNYQVESVGVGLPLGDHATYDVSLIKSEGITLANP